MGSTYDDVDDLELYTQVPPVTQLPAFSPEPTEPNQQLVLVTLQRGKNGPEKKYDLSFGVDEGANMKMLIEKAMKLIPDSARHFRVRRNNSKFQEYVETNTEDPVQHTARYHIRYAGYDEPAKLFSPPSTPRQSTANRQAEDVQCIDLTDDSPDNSAPATPSDNDNMMPPPSSTLRRKRQSTGDSTPTSTKRIRPLLSKTHSDVQSQIPVGQPSMQSLGYQPLSVMNAAVPVPQAHGSSQTSTPVVAPYTPSPQHMTQGYPAMTQNAAVPVTNGATPTSQQNGSPQLSTPIGSPYAPQPVPQGYPMMNQYASMAELNESVAMTQPNGSSRVPMPNGSPYSPQPTPMMNRHYSPMPDMNMNYAMPPCALSMPQPVGPTMTSPSPRAPNGMSGPRLLRTASFQPTMGTNKTAPMNVMASSYSDPYAASPAPSPNGYGMAAFGRTSY